MKAIPIIVTFGTNEYIWHIQYTIVVLGLKSFLHMIL